MIRARFAAGFSTFCRDVFDPIGSFPKPAPFPKIQSESATRTPVVAQGVPILGSLSGSFPENDSGLLDGQRFRNRVRSRSFGR